MGFGRKKQEPEAPATRRRLQDDYQTERPQAFSYYARRTASDANTGRIDAENTRPARKSATGPGNGLKTRLIAVATVCFLAAATVLLSSLSAQPEVVLIKTNGSAYFLQPADAYAASAQKALESSLLNKNKLTVDTSAVSAELRRNYPEVKSATVVLPLFGMRPTVYIEPYRPSFILTTAASSAYLLDEHGRALVSVSQITDTGELSVPTIQDKSGLVVKLGGQVLPRSTVAFIEEVLRVLAAQGIDHSAIVLPPGSSELDVAIAGKPYTVKFNLQGDARQQAGTYIATKLRLERDKTPVGQHIDVRVPERAYIR